MMATEKITGDLYVKRVTSEVGGESDVMWIVFERGIKHPLIVLSDFEAQRMAKVFMEGGDGK